EVLVGFLAPRRADDRELLRQQSPKRERVQRGHQLALRQVARGAEDHEHARLRPPPHLEALEERVALGGDHSDRTAWPPNWLRRAAFTFAANDSSWREAKRANNAAVITGTGTSSAIASAIVQRPSPESSTYPRMPARSEPSC